MLFKLQINWQARAVLVLLLMLVVSGCGAAANGSGGASSGQNSSSPAAVESEQPAAEANAAESTENRTFKHAMGETVVAPNPQKVVVLDNGALDNMLALGVKPVGAPSIISVDDGFATYLTGTEGIANIGTVEQPSLETIASLKPDVIIGIKDTQEAIYEQLSQIAPTVFTEVGGAQWEANLALHAAIVGKEAEGKKLIEQLDAHIADLHAKLGDSLNTTEVSLLRPRKDRVSVYLKPSFTGGVVERAGIKRPAVQSGDDDFNFNATEEQIADLDGDAIILFGRESEQDYFEQKIKSNPLWNTLEGVKNDRVYVASWEVWLSGHGIQAVNIMIDDLAKFLVKA
ncbi:ABC transporter substrate-binding protein [Paenibacillus sp. Leaf72]|uniref:ABC transporter substrate-binding protein n=1 Tax=Paenibacillus sp. Leaf72 TaxID=1736234 RepID=UPI0006F65822|nr:iron-siderophore ABC transporter substrate-binding protein [Paenibacillus sp. Leaf72]KQN99001.1 hypothetical protein ASF12_19680 [Paenibacillus sp. Leaf72]